MFVTKELSKKWEPILESADAPAIDNKYKKNVVTQLLENQQKEARGLAEQDGMLNEATPVNVTGNVAKYEPIMISMVRRAMPNLIAYDICGVQAMNGPASIIFAMRPTYVTNPNAANAALGADAFYNEADTDYSGTGTHEGTDPGVLNTAAADGNYTSGTGMATSAAELLGAAGGTAWNEMGFDIEKITITAKTRALKAQYSVELAQDMKQIHGLEAEQELVGILSAQILADINREIIRTVVVTAKTGSQNTTTAGIYDIEADNTGRWEVEKFKCLMYQIEKEANLIAVETRRGKGNVILCSMGVATALAMTGLLDTGTALSGGYGLDVDPAGNTFAGVLNGKYKVFIDPYSTGDYFVVAYRGANMYDAGLFYAPYVPLQMFKALDDNTMQPKIGFKTRYGLVANPFAEGATRGQGALNANSNVYYRRTKVVGL